MKFLDPLDLTGLEILNVRAQNLAGNPAGPGAGQYYFNSSDNTFRYWNGAAWVIVSGAGGTITSVTGAAPITSTGGTTPTIGIDPATGATAGSMSAADYTALHAATALNTASALVLRDAGGNFAAGTITATKITGLAAPTAASDGANKSYVDAAIQGVDFKETATVATTAALPANTYANGAAGVGATITFNATGAVNVDGHALAAGDVVLVKNEAAATKNGLYTVTTAPAVGVAGVLTRHADMDTAGEFAGAVVPVGNVGTANANSLWLANPTGAVVVGTTNIPLTQLNGATQLNPGTGIAIAGNTISIAAAYPGQLTINTVGNIVTGTWSADPIDLAHGGTGATTAAGARAALAVVGKYSALIGDGATTAIAIPQATHGLATNAQMVAQVFDAASGAQVLCDVTMNNANGTITFTFAVPPNVNAYRVVILG